LSLTQAVAKLSVEGVETPYTGTAWLCSRQHALTAAHCVGDRRTRELLTGGITLRFPWGDVAATVERHDFDLDAALLALASEPPPAVAPVPVGTLPALDPWPQGARALGWHAYGYPSAHQSGLTLTGLISSPDGNVEGSRAVELFCHMGGLGSLEGASGSAVCYGSYAFGLIRYGPPQLRQAVIHATSLKDIAGQFPEVAGLLSVAIPQVPAPAQGNTFRQTKITVLGKRLAAFIEEYEAVNAQLGGVLDAAMRVRLGRQVEELEESIRKTEAELDGLR
jgi:hypothetical protein